MDEKQLSVGQIWSLNDCTDRASVQKLEAIGDLQIVHIVVLDECDGLRMGHMPFERRVFLASVDKLIRTAKPRPEFQEGYDYWLTEFRTGDAGVFSIKVCEALNLMDL